MANNLIRDAVLLLVTVVMFLVAVAGFFDVLWEN